MSRRVKMVSAKAGLQAVESPLDAASFFNGLAIGGVMEKKTYLSTTGSGEEKYYWVIADDWLQFGANKGTVHEFRTEPVFLPEAIPALLVAACEGLLAYARAVKKASEPGEGSPEHEAQDGNA
jgi:hypothetical protein